MGELSELRRWVLQSKLATGEENMSREILSSNGVTSGAGATAVPRFAFFTALRNRTSTQVRMYAGATAAGATPTLARIGLWRVEGSTATLVASTVNDTTLFSVAFASYTRNWQSSYQIAAGARYGVAAVIVTAAAAPTLGGWNTASTGYGAESIIDPVMNGQLAGQTDLPASFDLSSLAVNNTRPYAVVL